MPMGRLQIMQIVKVWQKIVKQTPRGLFNFQRIETMKVD